jgi:abortive infection bacteriophage resistance protein
MKRNESNDTRRPPSDIDDWLSQEIKQLRRAFEQGNKIVLYDVMHYCEEYNKPLPTWALQELIKLFDAPTFINQGKRKHVMAKELNRYKRDMVDYVRADTVLECREHKIKWEANDKKSRRSIYDIVSDLLIGTFACGSASAIEDSYKKYKKTIKTEPFRYKILQSLRLPDTHNPLPDDVKSSIQE